MRQHKLHKKSIVTQIKKHIDSLTAILVLVNGTLPCVTVGTDYVLSMLSAIFPNTVTNNVAFLYTNVLDPGYLNFPQCTLPGFLKDAPHFTLNNPIALQKKRLELNNKDGPTMKMSRGDSHVTVKTSEQNALEMLVDFFDRLDSLKPQPMVLLIKAPNNFTRIRALMGAFATKKTKDSAVRSRSRSTRRSARTTVCLFSTAHPRWLIIFA